MKTEEAIKDIECIVVGQKSLTQEQRNQIKTVLESYAKEHSEEIEYEFRSYIRSRHLSRDWDGWHLEWIKTKEQH